MNADKNTISVQYVEFFLHSNNSHDILKLGMITVKMPVFKKDEACYLTLIHAPKDFDQTEKYKDQSIIGLCDQTNRLFIQQAGAKMDQKNRFSDAVFGDSFINLTKNQKALMASIRHLFIHLPKIRRQ